MVGSIIRQHEQSSRNVYRVPRAPKRSMKNKGVHPMLEAGLRSEAVTHCLVDAPGGQAETAAKFVCFLFEFGMFWKEKDNFPGFLSSCCWFDGGFEGS